tara:strand:- start:2823 stop:3506 length:684 start_codon:yes stop_codon:yes gene_type:complete
VPSFVGHRLVCEGAVEAVAAARGVPDDQVESILRGALQIGGGPVLRNVDLDVHVLRGLRLIVAVVEVDGAVGGRRSGSELPVLAEDRRSAPLQVSGLLARLDGFAVAVVETLVVVVVVVEMRVVGRRGGGGDELDADGDWGAAGRGGGIGDRTLCGPARQLKDAQMLPLLAVPLLLVLLLPGLGLLMHPLHLLHLLQLPLRHLHLQQLHVLRLLRLHLLHLHLVHVP